MKPFEHQERLSNVGLEILKSMGLVYFAMEERTGKTLTAIVCAEKYGAKKVGIVTTKKALPDWLKTLKKYEPKFEFEATNFHQVKKLGDVEFDLVIVDEAHKNVSAFPDRGGIWQDVNYYTSNIPIIYLSATPHAQGYHLLFNQLALSDFSPWRNYFSPLDWFKDFGFPRTMKKEIRKKGRRPFNVNVPIYTAVKEQWIEKIVAPYFVTATRKELGFEHEPEDHVHYVELSPETKSIYNYAMETGEFQHGDTIKDLTDDSAIRAFTHALEGGTMKLGERSYADLDNQEKIDYILNTWGDSEDMVIMYHFKGELIKLKKHFKNARLLQGVSNAEGVDLSDYEHLIIYSQNYSSSSHSQRRARQANMFRKTPIKVHFLLVRGGVSEGVYQCVAVNLQNYVISRFKRKTI